ncbi:esterase [Bordetella sp. 15P40C-2]|uniref:esterase n=1 Tax=Bordetella sp. 15P40C-2 TaxID=2572246 RepID=UPI00132B545A|nr:esterase [Bordetella sp. 15P40C-2]MVW70953.1 esterase [Bordetella sp. 15P40C-2]
MSEPEGLEFLPEADTDIKLLFVLLHGVGGTPQHLVPLAEALRAAFPAAAILVPAGFEPYDSAPSGRQWFSARGIDEDNRAARVAQAMPALVEYVRAAQARFGLLQSDTALAGFSQGAIMALEAVQAHDGLAGRVLAFSGRYARLPKVAPHYTTIHLLHGADDAVMNVSYAQTAQAWLDSLHGDCTIDVASKVGHELHPALVQRAIERLQTCVPLRSWEAALGLNQTPPSGETLH